MAQGGAFGNKKGKKEKVAQLFKPYYQDRQGQRSFTLNNDINPIKLGDFILPKEIDKLNK
jgi:hypothetical protein